MQTAGDLIRLQTCAAAIVAFTTCVVWPTLAGDCLRKDAASLLQVRSFDPIIPDPFF